MTQTTPKEDMMTRYEVRFYADRDGRPMARVEVKGKHLGKVAFPDRRWRPAPKVGETWEVEVSGENRKGTVAFLMPVRKIDVEREERRAAFLEAINNAFQARGIFKEYREPRPLQRAIEAEMERLLDSDVEIDGGWRRGRAYSFKNKADKIAVCRRVEKAAREAGHEKLQRVTLEWNK